MANPLSKRKKYYDLENVPQKVLVIKVKDARLIYHVKPGFDWRGRVIDMRKIVSCF